MKSSSRDSLVQTLRPNSSKSARSLPGRTILSKTELSLQSHVFFADLIFPKVPRETFSYQSSSPCSALFCRHRGPQPRKQRPYTSAIPGATKKEQRVSHPQVFSPAKSFLRTLTLLFTAPTCKWWQNVVDMMMTWWKDCPWTFVHNLEVFELKFIWLNDYIHPRSHFSELLLFSLLLPRANDDKMLLTWWWHDGKIAPGHSSTTWKFSN